MRRSLKINKSLLAGLLVFAQVVTPSAGVVLKNTNVVYAQETVQDTETQTESQTTLETLLDTEEVLESAQEVTEQNSEAQTETQTSYSYVQKEDGTIAITSYTGDETQLVIPESIDGMVVSSIADRAFFEHTSLISVTFPETLTEIGDYAFFSCTRLESASLPTGLQTLGEGAFEACKSLTDVTIPGSVTAFGSYAFEDCSMLTAVTIEDGITQIPSVAFSGCSALINLTIADSVKEIGDRAFFACSVLETVTLPSGMQRIGQDAFSGTTLKSVTTDAAVIADNAFSCGMLESVVLEDGVTQIGASAFSGPFESISIPSTVTQIATQAFSSTELKSYEVSEANQNFTSVDDVLYTKDKSVLLSVPVNWKEENSTFELPAEVSEIGDYAFYNNRTIQTIVMGEGVKKIGTHAFASCGALSEITLPDSLEEIGDNAFSSCWALEKATIGPNVKELPEAIFDGCSSLTELTLSEGLVSIGNEAFGTCENLKTLLLPNSLELVSGASFDLCSPELTLELKPENTRFSIKEGSLCSYDGTELVVYIDRGSNVYIVPDGITTMRPYCISSSTIKSITIPSSVTNIQDKAFGFFVSGAMVAQMQTDKNESLAVCGFAGSEAERYATENGFAFYTGKPIANAQERLLCVGDTFLYTIENANPSQVAFASSDNRVARVDQNGLVEAVGMGNASIFAKIGSDSYRLKVSVDGDPVEEDPFDSYYEADTDEKVDEWMAAYNDYNSDVSMDQLDNINTYIYTTGSYVGVMAKLVGGSYKEKADGLLGAGLYENFAAVTDGLKEEVKKYKLHENTKLFSGTSNVSYITGAGSSLADITASIGKTFTYDGVISTSLSHDVASNFGTIILEIYAPKDQTDGAYVEGFSEFPVEHELLLNAGNSYRVMDAGIRTAQLRSDTTDESEEREEYFIKLELLPRTDAVAETAN